MKKVGKVYLIGAGPGDPGLITVKGQKIISLADVIVYDYLVNTRLLGYAGNNCEIINVGKKSGHKELPQSGINKLLVEKAKRGNIVARLKGGDPFIFGRGAEEASVLAKNKIDFEIVPGLSSDYAVPEYAGIPPTHRNTSSSVAVITGHEDPEKTKSSIPWAALAKMETLIVLMGIRNLSKIISRLKKHGKSSNTKIAVITWGTYTRQKTLTGTFRDIIGKISKSRIEPPGIIVIGEVVKFREHINWFEKKPLYGKKILITRPIDQSVTFAEKLEELGAETIIFPAVKISPPDSWRKLDRSLKKITEYDWIIFTSSNGVRFFFGRINDLKISIRAFSGIKFAVIGEKTSETLADKGFSADIVPSDYRAEGLLMEFKKFDIISKKILIPRAREAREVLPKGLKNLGADVDVVTAYQNIKPESLTSKSDISELRNTAVDVITFTSPSTVKNFYSVFSPNEKSFKNRIIASIGPVTSAALEKIGLTPDITPDKYTTECMLESIVEYYTNN